MLKLYVLRVPEKVLIHLRKGKILKNIRKTQKHHLPPNPKISSKLIDLPHKYKTTFSKDTLSMYDSQYGIYNNDEGKRYQETVFLFSTLRNMELLVECDVFNWNFQ